MKIGLIGLSNSGKTTIFNALTGAEARVTDYAMEKAEPNLAVVEVMDERIDVLSSTYKPGKTIHAALEVIDFPGPGSDHAAGEAFSAESMGLIRNVDALALVIRNFSSELMSPPEPQGHIVRMEEEMVLADMMVIENRLDRIARSYERGKRTAELEKEEGTLRKVHAHVNNGRPIRDFPLNGEEEKLVRGFRFLSGKPVMVVLNSDEDRFGNSQDLVQEIKKSYQIVEFSGKFEMELSLLSDDEEARMFMEDMGIEESARRRLTRTAYRILGYISFFTVGTDEVRAWNLRGGDTALDAASSIHSDLARGFIRAECFSYADWAEFGSEKALRDRGRMRLEGKEYMVRDGDILSIRFNV